jgi:methyl-accepting chemotaxis protein
MLDRPISSQIKRLNAFSLGALLTVAFVGMLATMELLLTFTEFSDTTQKTTLVQTIAEKISAGRIAAFDYRTNGSGESAASVRENFAQAAELERQIISEPGVQPDLKLYLQTLEKDAETYVTTFAAIVKLDADRGRAIKNMEESSLIAQSAIEAIMNAAFTAGDVGAAYYAGLSVKHLLSGRLQMDRYLRAGDPTAFEGARTEIEEAKRNLNRLTFLLSDPESRKSLGAGVSELDSYWNSSEQVFSLDREDRLQHAELDTIGHILQQDVRKASSEVTLVQDGLSEAGLLTGKLTLAALLVLSGVSALGLGLYASRISYGIRGALDTSISEMTRLANGELEIDISATESETEIGNMARAMIIFRDNAQETKRLATEKRQAEQEQQQVARQRDEAEKIAERDRQAERQRERDRMITDLSDSIGTVVSAAANGDFSRRIEIAFDSELLQEMARSINAMMDSVESGIAASAEMLEAIADGDLTKRMAGNYKGLFRNLSQNLDRTAGTLSDIVSEITQQAIAVGSSSDALNAQAGELARRAERQAAALEQTSATMEEISESARSSAAAADRAQGVADSASGKVTEASSVVASAVAAMADIRVAADKIGEIVSVIDGIAYQTNLLALNASVEAARAGDAGKGFAVVASEVRALAQRSGEASRDIKGLIGESADQINRGVGLVEETGRTLETIVTSVKDMSETMRSLTLSAREQASGVGEVNRAIGELDAITQKNAALADQSRVAGARLSDQTQLMRALVQRFQISSTANSHSIAAE